MIVVIIINFICVITVIYPQEAFLYYSKTIYLSLQILYLNHSIRNLKFVSFLSENPLPILRNRVPTVLDAFSYALSNKKTTYIHPRNFNPHQTQKIPQRAWNQLINHGFLTTTEFLKHPSEFLLYVAHQLRDHMKLSETIKNAEVENWGKL